MNANYTIINRESALSILNATEKRCSSRTFGDLEAIEAALKDLLESKGYAKTCNSKLKGVTAIVGETTGEDRYIEYSKRHSYPNSNQTTFVHLSHNGKGWELTEAERDYTNYVSSIKADGTQAGIDRENRIEKAKKQLADNVTKALNTLKLSDLKGVERTLNAVVTKVILKDYANANGYETYGNKLFVQIYAKEFGTLIDTEVPLPEGNLFCENCEDCENCRFCENCKGCVNCVRMRNCKDCEKCSICSKCNDCIECKSCMRCNGCYHCEDSKDCNDCARCNYCYDCTSCKYCKQCEDCENCENCENCKDCNGCTKCENVRDCKDCDSCRYCYDCENCESCVNCSDCTDCKSCRGCRGCNGYEDAHGVQLTADLIDIALAK